MYDPCLPLTIQPASRGPLRTYPHNHHPFSRRGHERDGRRSGRKKTLKFVVQSTAKTPGWMKASCFLASSWSWQSPEDICPAGRTCLESSDTIWMKSSLFKRNRSPKCFPFTKPIIEKKDLSTKLPPPSAQTPLLALRPSSLTFDLLNNDSSASAESPFV